jgi:hypothetical protein
MIVLIASVAIIGYVVTRGNHGVDEPSKPTAASPAATPSSPAPSSPVKTSKSTMSANEKGARDIPLEATKDDLLTKLGRVYERDNYWLGKKLDGDSPGWRNLGSKYEPAPIDNQLTAEDFFKSNGLLVYGPTQFDLSKCEDRPGAICNRSLPEGEVLRLWGLNRLHNMASLVVYKKQCSNYQTFNAIDKIESQFNRLPEDVRSKAVSHEIHGIEARKDYTYQGVTYPGGWRWFCKVMQDDIAKGTMDHMFHTADEGYFPID